MNYFELFSLPVKLSLDEVLLQKKYYSLSRKHHPDFFENTSPSEKRTHQEFSALINTGYKTLKDKKKRMLYTIELYIQDEDEKEKTHNPLLMDMIEVREQVDRYKNSPSEETLDIIRNSLQRLKKLEKTYDDKIESLIEKFDVSEKNSDKKSTLRALRKIILSKNYLDSLLRSIIPALPEKLKLNT